MKNGFGMKKILNTIHIYPTFAESNKFSAGNWKKNQVAEKKLAWGERINRWRRIYVCKNPAEVIDHCFFLPIGENRVCLLVPLNPLLCSDV